MSGPAAGPAVLVAGLVLMFAAVAVLAVTVAGTVARARRGDDHVRRRLSAYAVPDPKASRAAAPTTRLAGGAVARRAVRLAHGVVARRGLGAFLDARLEAAGLPLRADEWLVVHVTAAVGVALTAQLVGAGSPVMALAGLLVGVAAPCMVLGRAARRRHDAFVAQLPDTLQLVASGLQAGHSLPQALSAVVREAGRPVSDEFGRAMVDARLGRPVEDALEEVARRTGSRDFAWVVLAIRIQREVGGNLAEVLLTVAATVRERDRLRRQVHALSAEGRLSGWVLVALPVGMMLFLSVAQPEYVQPLVATPLGHLMLVGAVVLCAAGAFWISRVVAVKV